MYIYIYESYGKLPFFLDICQQKHSPKASRVCFFHNLPWFKLMNKYWRFCRGCFWITTSWLPGVFCCEKKQNVAGKTIPGLEDRGWKRENSGSTRASFPVIRRVLDNRRRGELMTLCHGRSSWGTPWKFSITIWAMKNTVVGWAI